MGGLFEGSDLRRQMKNKSKGDTLFARPDEVESLNTCKLCELHIIGFRKECKQKNEKTSDENNVFGARCANTFHADQSKIWLNTLWLMVVQSKELVVPSWSLNSVILVVVENRRTSVRNLIRNFLLFYLSILLSITCMSTSK